jgi:hypothetical protein
MAISELVMGIRRMAWFKAARKLQWLVSGKPLPPPHCIKEEALFAMRERYGVDVLVETGTFLGETVFAMMRKFRLIYSIELAPKLFERAVRLFEKHRHVTILNGDSAAKLPEVLSTIKEPALFWLDGHYCGGLSALADKNTPIVQELGFVFGHTVKNHVIVIDDARLFTGQDGYPTIDYLRDTFASGTTGYSMEVENDMIFLMPPQAKGR